MTSDQQSPRLFGARLAGGYGWFFLGTGIYLPFFPIWLESKGLTAEEIGVILAIPIFVRVITSGQISAYADTRPDRAVVLSVLYWLSVATAILFLAFQGFWPLAAIVLLYGAFSNPLLPIMDALTFSGVRRFAADYGKIRVWGSLAFMFANVVGGLLLGSLSAEFIIWTFIGINFLGALYSHLLPRIGRANPNSGRAAGSFGYAKAIKISHFLPFLLAAGLLQASHTLFYSFGSLYWQTIGFSGTVIGALWALGVFAEVCLFQISSHVLKYVTPMGLLVIGALGAILRWTVLAFEPGLALTVGLQLLHGLSFGATHIATMYFIMQTVPEDQTAGAQGMAVAIGGATMGIGTFTAGYIYDGLGPMGFLISTAMSVVALVITIFGWKYRNNRYPQSLGEGGDTMDEA